MTQYTSRSITNDYVKRYPDSRRLKGWAGKLVHIRTNRGVWRVDGHGYTTVMANAWVLPFEEAIVIARKLGKEKKAMFILADGQSDLKSDHSAG